MADKRNPHWGELAPYLDGLLRATVTPDPSEVAAAAIEESPLPESVVRRLLAACLTERALELSDATVDAVLGLQDD